MENALLIGLSRQVALGRELDVIANNMANVTTNGFKTRSSRFQEYMMPVAKAEEFPRPDRKMSYVIDKGTPLDMSQGAIERTGQALDTAIKGDGFYVTQTPQGERYTRNGAFSLNARGELVTSDGHSIQGENGPIVLGSQDTGVSIGHDGTVSTDQGQRGKIRLVQFANVQTLKNEGANLFSSPIAPQPAGPLARIESGVIERSNVKPVLEMSRLISVNRSYGSVASMISQLSELRRSAISRLSDTQA